jgi:hypothetical protein
LAEPDLDVPHEEASCTFVLGTAGQLEHLVTVEVVDKDQKNPVENARVLLRPLVYRGWAYNRLTDDSGTVKLRVAKGDYQLYVSTDEYEKLLPSVKVDGDLTLAVELSEPLDAWRKHLTFRGLSRPGPAR